MGGGRRSVYWYAAGALTLTFFGVLASIVLSAPGFLFGIDTVPGFALSVVMSELGFAFVAIAFMLVTGRGIRYFDLQTPASWGFVAAVTLALFMFRTASVAVAFLVGVEPSEPAITEVGLPIEVLIAVMIPASILVIGPAEELLFRGTIQKYLGERVPRNKAIVGAGALFAAIHLPTFVVSSGLGAVVSLAVIFVVGVVLGWLYEHTGSVVAAMAAHAGYNTLIFGSGYIASQLI